MVFEESKIAHKGPSWEGVTADEHIIGIWILESQIY